MTREPSRTAALLGRTLETLLGSAEDGAIAFVRCLSPDMVERLARSASFAPEGWRVLRVAAEEDVSSRTIPADRAVEERESKGGALLLLVDTALAGAGMDGIYSASREVTEADLFDRAARIGADEIQRRCGAPVRRYAERAIRAARRGPFPSARSDEFDFLCRVAGGEDPPGSHLAGLGLWPVADDAEAEPGEALRLSRLFATRLLGAAGSQLPPDERVRGLRIDPDLQAAQRRLEQFLHRVDTLPAREALRQLEQHRELWVGPLRLQPTDRIRGIELKSWRNRNGTLARWSGLKPGPDPESPPELVLRLTGGDRDATSFLEVRWKTDPPGLPAGAVEYQVSVRTDQDELLAVKEPQHRGLKGGEKVRFTAEDLEDMPEDAVVSASVVLEVVGQTDRIEPGRSEEFQIRFGDPGEIAATGAGKEVRAFSEGLIELPDRAAVTRAVSGPDRARWDPGKQWVTLSTPVVKGRRRSFRVRRPALIAEVEDEWAARQGEPGRWTVHVRADGSLAGSPAFEPVPGEESEAWERILSASRRLSRRFADGGGLAQVYDDARAVIPVVREYLAGWSEVMESDSPDLALANTLEVRQQSGRTIGLIVLPAHPIRVAWHAAYDSLVFHAAFVHERKPNEVRKELASLDGAMFPAFLPNPAGGAFVFADMLGFQLPAMVPDLDPEPKAAVALLARALGGGRAAEQTPTVGGRSARALASEVIRYLEAHHRPRVLGMHALRAGDGLTVARALGQVHEEMNRGEAGETRDPESEVTFSLDLYPSAEGRYLSGRFITEAREKRRTRAAGLAEEDRWMLGSLNLPGGVTPPRLRWARKEEEIPRTGAHLAAAFDTFDSTVEVAPGEGQSRNRPFHAYGLSSFYERRYRSAPAPTWTSRPAVGATGEKHPGRRAHTEALVRVQNAIESAVARHLGEPEGSPVLQTRITPEKSESLEKLHGLADWVVTLDRNAGIEYFDSPREHRNIYDAYVIDCVPEREDLGCLQLITSTANLDEIRSILDPALGRMGLPQSQRNADFLLEQLKALSGRLAIRLTGQHPPAAELVALAVTRANCRIGEDEGWVSLRDGFLVPVDDVRELLPPLRDGAKNDAGVASRPDLIFVSIVRRRLCLRFIEVKYRRHLRAARAPETLNRISRQTGEFRKRWEACYGLEAPGIFRAIRRATLARVLRFYADKAARHELSAERREALVAEIAAMIRSGGRYAFADPPEGDLGWIFCPEYTGARPLGIWSDPGGARVYLCGPGAMLEPGGSAAAPRPESGYADPRKAPRAPEPPAPAPPGDQTESPPSASDAGVPEPPATNSSPGESSATGDSPEESSAGGDSPATAAGDSPAGPARVRLGKDTLTDTSVECALSVKGNPHLLIAGLPGMGKTTCLVNLCRQMVRQGVLPIVFSYHQDIDASLTEAVGPVRFVDFDGLGFNPLEVIARGKFGAHLDVAGAIRDIFAAIYPELGDVQTEMIRSAVKQSFEEAGWRRDESGERLPPFGRFMEILRGRPKPDRSLHTLLARLGELDDYGLFAPAPDGSTGLWTGDRPTVVRVHSTQNEVLQRAFSFLVFYGLYKDMFRRGIGERITHALVFDEAHRAAKLKLLPTMAKECRKYGVSLVLASQEARDFHTSVFSAIANYLILRCTEADARALVRNVATRRQEQRLVDRIKQMERYHALHFSEGRARPAQVALEPPARPG